MRNFYHTLRLSMRKKNKDWNIWLVILINFFIYSTAYIRRAITTITQKWYWIYIVLFLILLIILYFVIKKFLNKIKEKPASLWKKFEQKYPIIIQYTPPNGINPAEAWLLYNCKVDVTDLTCLIYQWALEWLISLKNIVWKKSKKIEKIELTKLNNIPNTRPFFEKEIFNSIFFAWNKKIIWDTSQLKSSFLLEDLEIHGIQKWRLYRPKSTKLLKILFWLIILLSFFSLHMFLKWISYYNEHNYWIFIFITSSFISIILWWYIFWWKSLKLTDEWAKLTSHLIWYRNFIKNCDENKIKLFLKDDPLFVDKIIPYATAFWIETEFIKKISPNRMDFYHKKDYKIQDNLVAIIAYLLR